MEPKPNKITRARAAMIQSQRFYGALALRLTPTERGDIETMATDGHRLFYNPRWVEDAPMPEVVGVTAKMVTHLALLHHTRRHGRDEQRWKKACDFATNPIVRDAGFTLPDAALVTPPEWVGKSAEEIFRLMPEDESEGQGGGGGGAGASGEPGESADSADQGEPTSEHGDGSDEGDIPGSDEDQGENPKSKDPGGAGQVLDAATEEGDKPSPADLAGIETEMQVATAQAENLAKQAGQGTEDTARMVREIKQAQHDWVEELRRFVTSRARDDFSWSRPNKRFVGSGVYLPSLHNVRMGEMVVAVDVSGSVALWLDDFLAQLKAIFEDVQPRKLYVVYCADQIAGVDEFEPGDEVRFNPRGMGGTSFEPPFDWVEEQGIDPACFLYLTDLYGTAPKTEPHYPVLWCCTTSEVGPWGETTRLRRN